MKKKLIFVGLIVFAAYILCFPKDAVAAAADGLVLWYEKVLPTLLPFAILSNILIYSNYLQYVTRFAGPVIRRLFPVSENGAFILLSGFLFGFPMGSRNCAELLRCGQISKEEADVLFIVTNNISPVFISSYILYQQLSLSSLTFLSFAILFLPPLAAGFILLRKKGSAGRAQKKPASKAQMNFKLIDAGIMNGFETLTRLGGYIMLFSMAASMVKKLPLSPMFSLLVTGITEITNGISLLGKAPLAPGVRYVLAMAFTAFGGLSGIAQTSSMIRDTGLSLKRYCILKCILAAVSALLAAGSVLLLGL